MRLKLIGPSIILIFMTVSCLEKRPVLDSKGSVVQASWFEGVKSAVNKGGIPAAVEVAWSRADRTVNAYRIYSLLEDPITRLTSWVLLDEVNADQLKYTHSGLNSGQIYTYKVQAVDTSGQEDGNKAIKATVAFEGIAAVQITGATTAAVGLNSSTGAFDEIRVYAVPKYATNPTQKGLPVAVGRGNISVINITGLQSGTPYLFYVNAYMSNIDAEDGNLYSIEGKTFSETFGTGLADDTNYNYRGFLNIQAYGLAPNAPQIPTATEDPDFLTKFPGTLQNPKGRLVRLTWLPFRNSDSATKYKVVRSLISLPMEFNNIPLCRDGSYDSSCEVCTVTGAGPQSCDDEAIGGPPKTYYYSVTEMKALPQGTGDYAEELPSKNYNDFKVKVAIPPDYMVLVQRNVANYEMCQSMGLASDPRKWQRCVYNGFGAKPNASGPTKSPMALDSGFFDQGYNFFVDRYRQACNWTKTVGHCGNSYGCAVLLYNGTTNSNPDNAIGVDGDVLWGLTAGSGNGGRNCFLKKSGVWRALDDTTNLTLADRASMITIDPGEGGVRRSPVAYPHSQASAFYSCQAFTTPYGQKRLMRRREYVVAAAFPSLSGEPNFIESLFDAGRIKYRQSPQTDLRYECDVGTWAGDTRYQATPADLNAMMTSDTNERSQISANNGVSHMNRYFIGTQQTIRCLSRYGNQGLVNASEGFPFSDSLIRTNSMASFPAQLRGTVSDYDAGNADLLGYEFGTGTGSMWGNAVNYSNNANYTATNGIAETASVWGPKFIIPIGLPVKAGPFTIQQDLFDVVALVSKGVLGLSAAIDNYQISYNNSASRYIIKARGARFGAYVVADGVHWSSSNHCAVEAE